MSDAPRACTPLALRVLLVALSFATAAGCSQRLRPFRELPVGIYDSGAPSHLPVLKAAGFNLVTGPASAEFLDAAAAHELGVLALLDQPAGMGFDGGLADASVAAFDHHPALWAWYVADEPDLRNVPAEAVREVVNRLKAGGAKKPAALVLMQAGSVLEYGGITDMVLLDRYPVPRAPLLGIWQHMRYGRLALGERVPVLAVIQAFDWSAFPAEVACFDGLRPPTFEEMRCMTYAALFAGADGIFYYAYEAGQWRMAEQPETWRALCRVVQEIKRRSGLLRSRAPDALAAPGDTWRDAYRDQGFGALRTGTFKLEREDLQAGLGAGWYVGAVNLTGVAHRATVYVGGKHGAVIPVVDEQRTVRCDRGRVVDDFGAYAVHFYGPVLRVKGAAWVH